MNGAAAVPDIRMSRPNSSTTTRMGKSHHFLLFAKKSQNSATKLTCDCSTEDFSKSLKGLSLMMHIHSKLQSTSAFPGRLNHGPGAVGLERPTYSSVGDLELAEIAAHVGCGGFLGPVALRAA